MKCCRVETFRFFLFVLFENFNMLGWKKHLIICLLQDCIQKIGTNGLDVIFITNLCYETLSIIQLIYALEISLFMAYVKLTFLSLFVLTRRKASDALYVHMQPSSN